MALTLDSLVRDLLMGHGESSTHLVARFTNHALSALDQLGYATPGATAKHIQLDIGARREVVVPDDLSQVLRVSAQSGEWLVPLVPDERLALLLPDATRPVTGDDDDDVAQVPVTEWAFPTAWGGAWQAAWGRDAGTYRYFPRERRLRFSTGLPASLAVMLEYLPNTNICGGETPIPDAARNAVDNYVLWRYSLSKEKIAVAREYESAWRTAFDVWKRQHGGIHPLTVARLSDEAAFGR